jgi:DNA (cytosine-5)-methyltransferase 1
MTIRTLDLFCGGGGSSWGAQAAGADIVCGVDAWDIATATFKANFPNAIAVNRLLSQKSGPTLLDGLGKIDLIIASPECTNHTCAKGQRPRDEKSKRTARYVLKFARELAPRWLVLENVVHMRSWKGYDPLINELEELGYNVLPQVLDATQLGVPQTRRRLFLLCDLKQEPEPILRNARTVHTAKSILDPEGIWQSHPLDNGHRAAGTLARADRAIKELGRGVPFLIVYYGSDGSGGWQSLDRPLRTMTTLDRFGLVTWKRGIPMLRMLQVPELRKAMGFTCGYRLDTGTRRDKIRILGNAVCPPVMEAVVRSLTTMTRVTSPLAAA